MLTLKRINSKSAYPFFDNNFIIFDESMNCELVTLPIGLVTFALKNLHGLVVICSDLCRYKELTNSNINENKLIELLEYLGANIEKLNKLKSFFVNKEADIRIIIGRHF